MVRELDLRHHLGPQGRGAVRKAVQRQVTLHYYERQQRFGINNLVGQCKDRKVMVEHGKHEVEPGMFVWDVGHENFGDGERKTVLHSLHIVVWARHWDSWGRTVKRMLVKFRPATPEEFALETVMNE